MGSGERERLIKFLAQNGIKAHAFSDVELRQQAQRVQSEQKLRSHGHSPGERKLKKKQQFGKKTFLTKKIPGK